MKPVFLIVIGLLAMLGKLTSVAAADISFESCGDGDPTCRAYHGQW